MLSREWSNRLILWASIAGRIIGKERSPSPAISILGLLPFISALIATSNLIPSYPILSWKNLALRTLYYAISSRAWEHKFASSSHYHKPQPGVPHISSSPFSELHNGIPIFSRFVSYQGALANAEIASLTNGSQLLAKFHHWSGWSFSRIKGLLSGTASGWTVLEAGNIALGQKRDHWNLLADWACTLASVFG